jgi:hypothetical protein
VPFDIKQQLSAGDTIDFAVGFGAGFGNWTNGWDSTGFNVDIDVVDPSQTVGDAARDFSTTSSSNGDWSYGSKPTLDGELSVYQYYYANPKDYEDYPQCGGLGLWSNQGPEYWDYPPYVMHRYSEPVQKCGTFILPMNMLSLHPGRLGEYTVVRWTAPASGKYRFKGAFQAIDEWTSTDVHIQHNSTVLLDGLVQGVNGGVYGFAGLPQVPIDITRELSAGDTLDFAVGYGGPSSHYPNESTGFNVVISSLSSPLGPAKLWVGLKNSDDQGTQFDVRIELYRNLSPLLSEGEARCITGVTRNPNLAKEVSILFGPMAEESLSSGDRLSFRVLTRIGTNPDGTKCSGPGGSHNNAVGLRLYHDATNRPSRFAAETTPGPLGGFFLHFPDFFDTVTPTASTAKYKDSSGVNFAGGNAWKPVGTWSMIVP